MPKYAKKVLNNAAHTNQNKYYCDDCEKFIIGSSYKYQCHLFGYHKAVKPRFVCTYCFKEYYRSDTFARHVSKHTGKYKKTYICDYCDRGFIDKRNLIQHLKVHDDSLFEHPTLNQYRCIACNISYVENRSLKQHIKRWHYSSQQNEPEYINKPILETWVERVLDSNVCVQLTKVDDNVIKIKKIENVHVEKKKRVIQPEPKKFLDEDNKSQFSRAICDYCKKEMIKKSLRKHIKEKHLKIRKFSCKWCNRSFMRNYQLVNHQCKDGRKKKEVAK